LNAYAVELRNPDFLEWIEAENVFDVVNQAHDACELVWAQVSFAPAPINADGFSYVLNVIHP